MKFLLLALILTGCGGMPPDEEFDPEIATCTTRAVRSNTVNTTEHSRDGGRTWLPGACTL